MSLSVILIIGFLLFINGLFAAYELALASVRTDRLRLLAEQKRSGASVSLLMKGRMEASLAAVQLGITLVGAIAAAMGGASAEESLAPYFEKVLASVGIHKDWADFFAIACVVIPISAFTIVVGELIPKVFALKNAELVCLLLSPAMWVFSIVFFPAVWLFEAITTQFVAIVERLPFMRQKEDHRAVGLHELRAQVNLLRASQAIGMQEERIILQASRLSAMKVAEIMLPEEDIVMVVADATLSENLIIAHMDLHTRFPVTVQRGDPQKIIGYVTFKDMVLLAKTHPGNPVIREIVRQISSLSENMTLSEALKRMTTEHQHLALVRGEGGRIVGMITQEDIFEELIGDIQDEFDRLPRHISPAGQQLVIGGGVSLAQLRTQLNRPELGGDSPDTMTLNDWLNAGREDNLKGGDTVIVDGVWAQVRKVRRRRITEALLDPLGNPFDAKRSGVLPMPETPK
ncbi:hemolysin family protein [Anatilimnocola floriformis]|uniref:hemolysin family protein n=1 Tax=Anatilimnocola floriformis TaxID=2948575 RepID=UPI0020C4DD06|nr:hemolysin family protein [Anatilimnocola floriformis]